MSSSTFIQQSINTPDVPVISPPPQAHLDPGRLTANGQSGHIILSSNIGDTSSVVAIHVPDNQSSPSSQRSDAEFQALAARALTAMPPTPPPNPRPPPQPYHNRSQVVRFMAYMGVGRNATRERKALVAVLQNIGWGLIQVTVVITMLVLTGTFFKSPLDSRLTEWVACDRPLGVWASLWVVRASLASTLAYWEYQRDRMRNNRRGSDAEQQTSGSDPSNQFGTPATAGGFDNPATLTNNDVRPSNEPLVFPYNRLYQRLTILSSLLTLTWFLTAHILVYTSINSCRKSSPHLWWLTFGILCTLYLMVVEVLILGLVVLLIAPIFIFFYNVILMCLGRHPIQRPHELKPDIPKLSKSIVDKIPLVVYIPPPDAEQATDADVHSYPPQSIPSTPSPQKRTSFFRSLSSFKKSQEKGEKGPKDQKSSWEDNWEQTEYPFVTLAGNRATCAICLMDFEEPERKKGTEKNTEPSKPAPKEVDTPSPSSVAGRSTSAGIAEDGGDLPRLEDAGEGVQPLRLLECGHVFHKTCLDPWLLDVSGRCPTCQRPIDKTKNRSQATD